MSERVSSFAHCALAAIFLLASCSVFPGEERDEQSIPSIEKMSETQEKAINALRLPDSSFFELDQNALREVQASFADLFSSPSGFGQSSQEMDTSTFLAVGAPGQANLEQVHTIPFLIGSRQSGVQRWAVNYLQNLHLIISDLKSGTVHVRRPLIPNKRMETPEPSGTGNPPEGTKAIAMTTGVRRFDFENLLGHGLRQTRYAVTALLMEHRSNSIEIEITGVPGGEAPYELTKASPFVSAMISDPASLEAKDLGSSFSVPDVVSAGTPISVNVDIKKLRSTMGFAVDAETREPLLRLSLVLIKLDEPQPIQIDIVVPIAARRLDNEEILVESKFSFDLRTAIDAQTGLDSVSEALDEFDEDEDQDEPVPVEMEVPEPEDLSGSYQAYLVVGDEIQGPIGMTINN